MGIRIIDLCPFINVCKYIFDRIIFWLAKLFSKVIREVVLQLPILLLLVACPLISSSVSIMFFFPDFERFCIALFNFPNGLYLYEVFVGGYSFVESFRAFRQRMLRLYLPVMSWKPFWRISLDSLENLLQRLSRILGRLRFSALALPSCYHVQRAAVTTCVV